MVKKITLPLVISLCACGRSRDASAERERRTPAYEVGRAPREISKESAKAAKAAGRELRKGAAEARDGWKDQSRADREKHRP